MIKVLLIVLIIGTDGVASVVYEFDTMADCLIAARNVAPAVFAAECVPVTDDPGQPA